MPYKYIVLRVAAIMSVYAQYQMECSNDFA